MIKSNNIVIDGLKIYYRTKGNTDFPPLVVLPAWGTKNGKTIPHLRIGKDVLIESLSTKFYVIDIEHPGLIRSQTPTTPYTFEQYATFYHKLLEQLHMEKFYLCGSSFGGGIACIYSVLFPKHIIAFFLTDSVVSKEYPVTKFVNKKRALVIQILESKIIPLLVKKLAINNYMGTPTSFITREEIAKKLAMCKSFATLNLDINYEEIKVPTLIVWGKDDKYVHPIEYGRDISKKIVNSKLIEISGAVDFIYTQPQIFLDHLLNYIATLNKSLFEEHQYSK